MSNSTTRPGVAAPERPRVPGSNRSGDPVSYRGRRLPRTNPRSSTKLTAAEVTRRIPFLVVVLVLIGVGVGATLWFSAQSTRETYALRSAQEHNVTLQERKEELEASIERSQSAEELASRAEQLGLLSVSSAPILVRGADGAVEIVGPEVAELGAPITPLQPSPVTSGPDGDAGPDRFEAPSAQVAPDSAPAEDDARPDTDPRAGEEPPAAPIPQLSPSPGDPGTDGPPPAAPPEALQPVPGT